jgi:hypothetical protein
MTPQEELQQLKDALALAQRRYKVVIDPKDTVPTPELYKILYENAIKGIKSKIFKLEKVYKNG